MVHLCIDRYFIVDIKLKLLNISILEKYDLQKMYKIYDQWPEIARKSFESKQETIDFQNIDHIVFAGMGGSGTIGDLISAILSLFPPVMIICALYFRHSLLPISANLSPFHCLEGTNAPG